MAPSTRPAYKSKTDDINSSEDMSQLSSSALNDPWLIESNQELNNGGNAAELHQGFEDSFVVGAITASSDKASGESRLCNYEQNKEYLNYLEAKLKRMEQKRRKSDKLSANDVISSLKEMKEIQMEWCFKQGISSSEDDVLDSDGSYSSGSGNSLTTELRRKMFPEQQALNETELLRLLDHDAVEKVSKQGDT